MSDSGPPDYNLEESNCICNCIEMASSDEMLSKECKCKLQMPPLSCVCACLTQQQKDKHYYHACLFGSLSSPHDGVSGW